MKRNVVKGFITSIIGIAIMLITLSLVFTGVMDWVWNGIGGIIIGTVLLLSPDTLVKKIGLFFRGASRNRDDDDNCYTPPPSNRKIDNPNDK